MEARAFIKTVGDTLLVVSLIAYTQRFRLRPTLAMALSVQD